MKQLGLVFLLVAGSVLTACGGGGTDGAGTLALDIPDDVKAELDAGAPKDEYIFYALAESPPQSWDDFKAQGLYICSDEHPPILPEYVRNNLEGGGFQPGTRINVDFEGMEETLQFSRLWVSVGITYEGCIKGALEEMTEPGLLLLTDRGADFEGKDTLVQIVFE